MAAQQRVLKCVVCSAGLPSKVPRVAHVNCSLCAGAICKSCIFGDGKTGKQSDTKTTEYLNALISAKLKVSVECGKCASAVKAPIQATVPATTDTPAIPPTAEIVKEAVSLALKAVKEEILPLIANRPALPNPGSYAEAAGRHRPRVIRHSQVPHTGPGARHTAVPVASPVRNGPESTAEERERRFQKSRNLRIRGLIARDDDESGDAEKLHELLSVLPIQLNDNPVESSRRFFKDGQEPVLIVTLKTEKDRDDILRGKSSLRNGPHSAVFIGRDLTRLQAQWEYERRCKRRQQLLEMSHGNESFADAPNSLPQQEEASVSTSAIGDSQSQNEVFRGGVAVTPLT